MKKILIISESIDVEDSSASKVNIALIQNLKKLEYQITVLHYTRKNIQLGNGIECVAIPEIKLSLNYLLSRTQRIFQRVTKTNISKRLENIFGHSFTFFNDSKSISNAVKKYYVDEQLVITLSKGASFRSHHAILSVSKLHNIWLAYVHDPYPFHYYPRPYDWLEAGAKFKENFFREVSGKAEYSGFPSQLLKEWMGSYFPDFLKTGVIIPHQSINIKCEQIELPPFFDKNKFNILHAGNLMNTRPIGGLIEGFKNFVAENPECKEEVQLNLIGDSSYFKKEIDEAIKLGLPIYSSKGYIPFHITNTIQQNTEVSLIIESDASISPFLPGKFPYCVVVNKPIVQLGPEISEVKRLLGDEYPYTANVNDSVKIEEIFSKLYWLWKKKGVLSLNRKDLEEYVGIQFLESQLKKILS
ncbi:hypothetical protein SAMN06265371_11198 [Lutibacter agarilyticus]|uniref:Uncharacterized protein n=1 Tax=Lutibacter agarilyticus TaxID=1109740 RepID=A0A238YXK6_9FLAO|nr:hypothetical protein [Lutibacter agarilyticus]SNR75996.1 hypothetical protein SAMN06265371_11198 [Lutibacter agarilyticus]